MTVTALVTRNDITATASQTSFTYTFRVLAATDMDVYQNGVLLSSGYTVNDVGNTTGGTVVLDSGVPVGQIVSLVLAMPLDRTTNYQNSGDFLAADVNSDFDKIYIGAVQNENEGGRSLRLKDVEPPTAGVDMTIPLKDDRKGKFLAFDSVTGAPIASLGDTTDASLVSYTPAGTGAVTTTVQAKLRETVSVEDFGAVGDGITDDTAAIQAAIDAKDNIYLPTGVYAITGLTLREGSVLHGDGYSLDNTKGTVLKLTSGTYALNVNGTFSPFDARRYIQIKNLSISNNVVGSKSINAFFMTRFVIENVYVYGGADDHLFMRNCYNGRIAGCRFSGATNSNCTIAVKNDAVDNVFSGQMLFDDCDFWGEETSAYGVYIATPYNILEQLQFNKCHFLKNVKGYYVLSGGIATLISPHFEENSDKDMEVEAGAVNPNIVGLFSNNSTASFSAFRFAGIGGSITGAKHILYNGATVRIYDISGNGMSVNNAYFRIADGSSVQACIKVTGENTEINNTYVFKGGVSGSVTVVYLDSGALRTSIGYIYRDNVSKDVVSVNGTAQYPSLSKSKTVRSRFVLNGGVQREQFVFDTDGYINRARVIYPNGTGASGGTSDLRCGTVTGGSTKYLSVNSASSASIGDVVDVSSSIASGNFFNAADTLLLYCAGSATNTEEAILEIEYVETSVYR